MLGHLRGVGSCNMQIAMRENCGNWEPSLFIYFNCNVGCAIFCCTCSANIATRKSGNMVCTSFLWSDFRVIYCSKRSIVTVDLDTYLFQNFDLWILAQLILLSHQVGRSSIYIIVVLIESEGSGLRVIQEMKPGGRSRYYIKLLKPHSLFDIVLIWCEVRIFF